eukprot:3189941-Rhodomonas_salina.4
MLLHARWGPTSKGLPANRIPHATKRTRSRLHLLALLSAFMHDLSAFMFQVDVTLQKLLTECALIRHRHDPTCNRRQ